MPQAANTRVIVAALLASYVILLVMGFGWPAVYSHSIFLTYLVPFRTTVQVLRREGRSIHPVVAWLAGNVAFCLVIAACAVLSWQELTCSTSEPQASAPSPVVVPNVVPIAEPPSLATGLLSITAFGLVMACGVVRLVRWWRSR